MLVKSLVGKRIGVRVNKKEHKQNKSREDVLAINTKFLYQLD